MSYVPLVDRPLFVPGITARLRCDPVCALDVAFDLQGGESQDRRALVEVWLQPQAPGTSLHLTNGGMVRILRQAFPLVWLPRRQQLVGRAWLAEIQPVIAPECYYRIRVEDDLP